MRYCKSTIFQANHNARTKAQKRPKLFAILQKYDFSSKSQRHDYCTSSKCGCLRYCKSTIFQANHNLIRALTARMWLFAILQKYDFSSKSQPYTFNARTNPRCLRYCKSTIFQANHNKSDAFEIFRNVVCDTAKVRFFKQITTAKISILVHYLLFAILQKYDFSSKSQLGMRAKSWRNTLFAILQKYDFSSKSQLRRSNKLLMKGCLRYCKSTIFQANHNSGKCHPPLLDVVCDTAKVRFFKQITTVRDICILTVLLFAILQKYDFSSKSQPVNYNGVEITVVCDTAKVRFFKQITTRWLLTNSARMLFAILQKYDFSSKSQL